MLFFRDFERTKKSIEQTNVHESKIIVSFRPSATACLPPFFFCDYWLAKASIHQTIAHENKTIVSFRPSSTCVTRAPHLP